jgi:hypothetical protein
VFNLWLDQSPGRLFGGGNAISSIFMPEHYDNAVTDADLSGQTLISN